MGQPSPYFQFGRGFVPRQPSMKINTVVQQWIQPRGHDVGAGKERQRLVVGKDRGAAGVKGIDQVGAVILSGGIGQRQRQQHVADKQHAGGGGCLGHVQRGVPHYQPFDFHVRGGGTKTKTGCRRGWCG